MAAYAHVFALLIIILSNITGKRIIHIFQSLGTRDDCVNVEEQYLEGIYTPDFLCNDDDASDTDKENQSPHNDLELTKGPKRSQSITAKKGPSCKKKKLTDKGIIVSFTECINCIVNFHALSLPSCSIYNYI